MMTTNANTFIVGFAVLLSAAACKHSPNAGSELAEVSGPIDPNNQDAMGNACETMPPPGWRDLPARRV